APPIAQWRVGSVRCIRPRGRVVPGRWPFGRKIPEELMRRAEMLLAALAGCASLPLRRGTLRQDAEHIVQIVHLRSEKNDYFEIAERN
ncbi:hypothetical protein P4H87_29625, partial [Paenibacillus macerans]|nr:hypothetical protein [Paenibacillus macerans]